MRKPISASRKRRREHRDERQHGVDAASLASGMVKIRLKNGGPNSGQSIMRRHRGSPARMPPRGMQQ
jgi:hypothetical protein